MDKNLPFKIRQHGSPWSLPPRTPRSRGSRPTCSAPLRPAWGTSPPTAAPRAGFCVLSCAACPAPPVLRWVVLRPGASEPEDRALVATHQPEGSGLRSLAAGHNRTLLYMQDADGDENWHIHGVDAAGNGRDYTPFQGVRAEGPARLRPRPLIRLRTDFFRELIASADWQ